MGAQSGQISDADIEEQLELRRGGVKSEMIAPRHIIAHSPLDNGFRVCKVLGLQKKKRDR